MTLNELPEIKAKKKIDIKKFEKLAKEVKEIFHEEEEYLNKKYGNSTSSRLFIDH